MLLFVPLHRHRVFSILIFVLIVYFAVKYRRRSAVPPAPVHTDLRLELAWTIIPLLIVLFIFFWGARVSLYLSAAERFAGCACHRQAVMWKIQHPSGRREINELHVPIGQPVRLLIASQDVIHGFYIPAFRIKQDAIPGASRSPGFRPTKWANITCSVTNIAARSILK